VLQFIDRLLLTLERLWQHRILVLWTLVGLVAATTLALSLTLYVDAVNTDLLTSHLGDPPYAFRFRYLGSWNGNITPADVTAATAAIDTQFAQTIGLPAAKAVNYTSGGSWTLALQGAIKGNLGAIKLSSLDSADSLMQIVAGEWPAPPSTDGTIPILLPDTLLYSMGVQVGDTLTATRAGYQPTRLKVAAMWHPINDKDPSWIFPPRFFDTVALMSSADLQTFFAQNSKPVEETAWYLEFDGSGLRTSDVSRLLGSIVDGTRDVTAALPGIRLDLTPSDGLQKFVGQVSTFTQQLVIMSLPVGGLVLYFVSLVAGLLVSRQGEEDAVLRSRGISRRAILLIHVMMWLLLTGTALAIGLLLCPAVVRLVGRTTSFLQFNGTGILNVVFTPQAIAAGAITGLIASSSGLYFSWRSSAQTITGFKRSAARASKAWWQRAYLDILLLIPALYVLYTLWKQGGLVTTAADPFSNPLAFVAPTLFSLAVTLLFLRLFPAILGVAARIFTLGRGVAILMALRELTRSIGRYRGTLLMICFTLSLTGFTASMASTIDKTLEDSVNYQIGADAVIVTPTDAQTEEGDVDTTTGQTTITVTGFNTLPADDLLTIDGVQQVSRVGRYPAQIVLANQRITGTILGIDRDSIAAVTRFRQDYSPVPIADQFNLLAGNRTGVLISAKTAADYDLRINQLITIQVQALGTWYSTKVPILGVLNYFPTLDPKDGFFLVGTLEPIFELVGTNLPYDLWLKLAPDADVNAIRAQASALGYPIVEWRDPQTALAAARAEPSRRGVLGFLSVGFVASILLTLVGAIIQSAASFRAQAAQLGSLRAMGVGGLSVGLYLFLLQTLMTGSGILSGTSIGVATTMLYLPLLDFSGGLPPYLVRVAWGDITLVYAAFAAILLTVTFGTTAFLGRERLSTIVKLGDA
jgi:putative ABC transport system permease protein